MTSKKNDPLNEYALPKPMEFDLHGDLLWTIWLKMEEVRRAALKRIEHTYLQEISEADALLIQAVFRGYNSIESLAKQFNISKQAVHKRLTPLVKLGYLCLQKKTPGSKTFTICLAPKGTAMTKETKRNIIEFEQGLVKIYGIDRIKLIHAVFNSDWKFLKQ